MSILPELIIQQALIRGIRLFREDERMIDMLFRNVDQKELQAIREFLRNDSIEICINYPDQDLKIPSIVILLRSEAESQAFIGNLQQDSQSLRESGYPFPADELLGAQTVVGSGSVLPITFAYPLLVPPTQAIGGTLTSIIAPDSMTSLIDPFEVEAWVVIIEGTAAGNKRRIESIMPALHPGDGVTIDIDLATPFTVIPDSTSIFKIIGPSDTEGATGEPSKLYTSEDRIERFGSIYRATYQLDICGPNQESVIYIYNIVKAIIFSAQRFLIKQGFLSPARMSGTDFMPAPDYYPNLVYRRSLSIETEYAFDVFKEVTEPIANHIMLALDVHDPDVSKYEDNEREASVVTFDIP